MAYGFSSIFARSLHTLTTDRSSGNAVKAETGKGRYNYERSGCSRTVSGKGEVSGRVSVTSGSVHTKLGMRDEHLRSAHFLASETYPAITFAVQKAEQAGSDLTISGTLTVRDQSRPVSFPATVTAADCGATVVNATVRVDRSDYGMTYSPLPKMVSLLTDVTVHAVFTKS